MTTFHSFSDLSIYKLNKQALLSIATIIESDFNELAFDSEIYFFRVFFEANFYFEIEEKGNEIWMNYWTKATKYSNKRWLIILFLQIWTFEATLLDFFCV